MNIFLTNKIILIALFSIFIVLSIYVLYINIKYCFYVKKYTNLLSFIDDLDEDAPKEIIMKNNNIDEKENLEDIIKKTEDNIILKNNII